MKILVLGAGAIGTLLGGKLKSAGNSVTFIEKADFINLLKQKGISLESDAKAELIEGCSFFTSLKEIPPREHFDLVIAAVKAYHLKAALTELSFFKNNFSYLLIPQNGIGSEELAARFCSAAKILSLAITIPVEILSPGQIRISKKGGLGIAGFVPQADLKPWQELFAAAGFSLKCYSDYRSLKWSKLLLNLLANSSSAILAMPPGEIFSDLRLLELELSAFRETVKIMQRQKIASINLPGYPVKFLTRLFGLLPAVILKLLLKGPMQKSRGNKMPSFYLDLKAGKADSEVEFLNGAVLKAAKALAIPAPANRTLYEILSGIVKKELKWQEFQHNPKKLLEEYQKRKANQS